MQDPKQRLALRDALEHPFLARADGSAEELLARLAPGSGPGLGSSVIEPAVLSRVLGPDSAPHGGEATAAAEERAFQGDGSGVACGSHSGEAVGEEVARQAHAPRQGAERRRPPSRHVGDVIAPQRTVVAAAQASSVFTQGGADSGTFLSDAFAADDEAEAEAEVEAPTPRRLPGRHRVPMPHPDLLSSHGAEWEPRPAAFPRPAVLDSRRGSTTPTASPSESRGRGAQGSGVHSGAPPLVPAPRYRPLRGEGPAPAPSRLLQTGIGMRPLLRRPSWDQTHGWQPVGNAHASLEGGGAAEERMGHSRGAMAVSGQDGRGGEEQWMEPAAAPSPTAESADHNGAAQAPALGSAVHVHDHTREQHQQPRRRRRAKRAPSHASAPAAPLGGSASMRSPQYRATGETIVAGGGKHGVQASQRMESPPPAALVRRRESEEVAMQEGSVGAGDGRQGAVPTAEQRDTAHAWSPRRSQPHHSSVGQPRHMRPGGRLRSAAVAAVEGAEGPADGAYCAGAYSASHSSRTEWRWEEASEGRGSAAPAPINAARPASHWARGGDVPEDATALPSARVQPLQGFCAAGPVPGGCPRGGGRWLPRGRHAFRLGSGGSGGGAAAWVAIAPDEQGGGGDHWHSVVCVSATPWGDAALRLRSLGSVLDVDLPRDMALAVAGAETVTRERGDSGSRPGRFCASVSAADEDGGAERWHAPLWRYLAAVQGCVRDAVPLCRAVCEGPEGRPVHLRCYGGAAGPASVLAAVPGCGSVHVDLRSGVVRATRAGEGGGHLSVHLDNPVEPAGGLPHWAGPLLCSALHGAGHMLRDLSPGQELTAAEEQEGEGVELADVPSSETPRLEEGDWGEAAAAADTEGPSEPLTALTALAALAPTATGAEAHSPPSERVDAWDGGGALPCERAARELVQEVQRLVEGAPAGADEATVASGGGDGGGEQGSEEVAVTTPPRLSALAAAKTPPRPPPAEASGGALRGQGWGGKAVDAGAVRRAVVDWWRDHGTGELCLIWRPPVGVAASTPSSRLDVERWSLSADGHTLRRGGAFGRAYPTAHTAGKLPAPARTVLRAMLQILDEER